MPEELINALVRDYENILPLSEAERRLLTDIKPQKLYFKKDSVVFREEEPANYFLLVKEGVCFNHRHLEDGSRQIMDLYFPGEVVALGELSRAFHVSGLTTFSDTVLLAYDKAEIKEQFSRSARLSRLFIELMSQEQANLTERLVGVSRYGAKQRVARFLLEVYQRSSRASNDTYQSCGAVLPVPVLPTELKVAKNLVGIPQVLIADALGLSIVHVNRVLRQFREEGYIRTRSQGIELLDVGAIKTAAGWWEEERRASDINDRGEVEG